MFIKVLIIEENNFNVSNIESAVNENGINRKFTFQQEKNGKILEAIATFNPHIILVFDKKYKDSLRLKEQERCLLIDINTEHSIIGEEIMKLYISLLNKSNNILFSIITPIYKTPTHKLERLYKSLLDQTYTNWEWIVFDDSPSDYIFPYNHISRLSKIDNRVSLYKKSKNSGIIGEVKKLAFSLGSGEVLVEVDHDDELIDTCLENLLIGYSHSNDIGFVYGHTCELYNDSNDIIDYGDNWAFGYGTYDFFTYQNVTYKTAIAPNINSKTIRSIVGIPNHVRSWKKDAYQQIGGHNKYLHVADDYELFIRTFLNVKILKIDTLTYFQYFDKNSNNTQFTRNAEIQRIVNYTANHYNNQIHDRFLQLNIDDFIWNNGEPNFWIENPEIEPYVNMVIKKSDLK